MSILNFKHFLTLKDWKFKGAGQMLFYSASTCHWLPNNFWGCWASRGCSQCRLWPKHWSPSLPAHPVLFSCVCPAHTWFQFIRFWLLDIIPLRYHALDIIHRVKYHTSDTISKCWIGKVIVFSAPFRHFWKFHLKSLLLATSVIWAKSFLILKWQGNTNSNSPLISLMLFCVQWQSYKIYLTGSHK